MAIVQMSKPKNICTSFSTLVLKAGTIKQVSGYSTYIFTQGIEDLFIFTKQFY